MDNNIPHKFCRICGGYKPLYSFVKSYRYKDGYETMCKICKNKRSRNYYVENSEKVIARTTKYNQKHPDIVQKSSQNWRNRNQEQLLESTRLSVARWREQHREKDRTASKQWRNENRSAYRAIQQKRRARVRGVEGSYTAQEWENLKKQYDYCCLCCGKREPEIVLTADHIIPLEWNGKNGFISTNYISNIQPLCRSCNARKGNRHATDYRY
jgi:5-methylcytosine-specific restriction endonuclease McrA